MAALAAGADIVLGGRTTDTAVLAAVPLMRGADVAAAWHAAKIAECGGLCTRQSDQPRRDDEHRPPRLHHRAAVAAKPLHAGNRVGAHALREQRSVPAGRARRRARRHRCGVPRASTSGASASPDRAGRPSPTP